MEFPSIIKNIAKTLPSKKRKGVITSPTNGNQKGKTRPADYSLVADLPFNIKDAQVINDAIWIKNKTECVLVRAGDHHYFLIESKAADSAKLNNVLFQIAAKYSSTNPLRVSPDVIVNVVDRLKRNQKGEQVDSNTAYAFLYKIAQSAYDKKASDIHISTVGGDVAILFRIDGVIRRQPIEMTKENVELMMRTAFGRGRENSQSTGLLDFNEFHQATIPIDVRDRQGNTRTANLRLSSNPKDGGHRQIMRVLVQETRGPREIREAGLTLIDDLTKKGYPKDQAKLLDSIVNSPGALLVVGETGSGKTSLLYTAIMHLATPGIVTATIEDPVEGKLFNVDQYSCAPNDGEDEADAYNRVWKAMMRSDNDIVMFGEIRTRAAAQAWLSGAQSVKKTMSTLHGKDWIDAYLRLSNEIFGIPLDVLTAPKLIGGLVHHTLIRKLCNCALPIVGNVPDSRIAEISRFGDVAGVRIRNEAGCPNCTSTGNSDDFGYSGRTPACTVIRPTEEFNQFIAERRFGDAERSLRRRWRKDGQPLADAITSAHADGMTGQEIGIRKMLEGIVDPKDVEREFGRFSLYLNEADRV